MSGNHRSTGQVLARFSTKLAAEDIPAKTRMLTKLLLLDSIGCLVVGRTTEDAVSVASAAASAFGGGVSGTSSPAQRALAIGYGISASGAIDSYAPAKLHTTPSVIGAVLALATERKVSGAELVVATALGLESAVRIADAFNPPELRARGWHSPGVIGPLAAALSCSRLMGLDVERTRDALGLAGSQSSGTFAAWGTPTVKFHQARGAMAGLLSATLAHSGFTSSPDVFGAPDGGLLGVYSDGGVPGHIVAGLGEEWRMHDLSLRLWPTPHINTVSAVLELQRLHGAAIADAEHIAIEISADAAAFGVFDSPETRFEAMNSIPLTAATALLSGSFDQAHLDPQWFRSAQVVECLKRRIQVSISHELPPGSIRAFPVPLRDTANVVEVHIPWGSRIHPIGRSALVDKFVRNVSKVWSEEESRMLAAQILAVEDLDDTGPLLEHACFTLTASKINPSI